jgi:hypothetical protein
VAVGAILAYYFAAAGSASSSYSFEGTDSEGNQIRASYSSSFEFEVLTAGAQWALYKSGQEGLYIINSGDSAWLCAKLNTVASAASLGQETFNDVGSAGGLTFFNIGGASIPVVVSSDGITNFAGYTITSFSFGASALTSFKSGLPALPASSECTAIASDEAEAVVESDTAPVCGSFPSLFAFLQKRTYASNSAANFCTGNTVAVVCTATISKTDTVLRWTGTDRALRCTNALFGTILSVSGSDDVTDWLKNLTITSRWFVGMTTHNGFYSKYSLWVSQYATWIGSSTSVAFNGHSLGGAISNVAAVAWKNSNPSHTVRLITCGAPAPFKAPYTSTFTGLYHKRHVNYEYHFWSPNERDPVSVVTSLVGYDHPNGILFQTKDGSSWGTNSIGVTAFIGDMLGIGLHTIYTTSMDAVRRSAAVNY